jgi:trehalose 6-phosphate synthase
MRITFRLILSLVIAAAAVVFVSTGFQARQEQVRLEEELERRASVLAESLQESAEPLVASENLDGLRRLVERFGDRERLAGIAVYASHGQPLAITATLPARFQELPEMARDAMQMDRGSGTFLIDAEKRWHLEVLPLHQADQVGGALLLVHDASYIDVQRNGLWRQNFVRLLFHVLLISLITLLIVQWNLLRPLSKTIEWIRRLRTGELSEHEALPKGGLFGPLAREVTHMAKSLTVARAAAEEEAKLRHAGESRWTPDRLKEHIRTALNGRPLLVIANREPYMHMRQGRQIRCIIPASGLVTAVEPILRACGGTWIAHGAGDADRETSDIQGKLRVPPETPLYTLKRVWLTKEEEDGYYYGFANEGLWPLCHIAHTRPLFRTEDWKQYVRVNTKFAQAALEELEGTENPCVLIQDYHFALLPRLIKDKRPDARIAIFWHIPWPNPEAFGICPWASELLHGMLGADLIGFHIQFHCNNFLDTVDRLLESRIDWEQFAINRAGHSTWIRPFPISIAAQEMPAGPEGPVLPDKLKGSLLKELGLSVQWIGVGVDRIDYTKGIAERFRAIERFLEACPDFQGKFTFIELGAPSRTVIKRYHDLGAELDAEVERINRRFQTRQWKPILFLKKHHSQEEIAPFYRAADVCVVTSLHDGMNLVAKEFVAARTDQQGVLILSRFAGASRELREALLVNPYDIEQVAEAMHSALTMNPEEQQARMERMRRAIQEHNVYQWAANLVTELTRIHPVREQDTSLTQPQAA